MCRSEDWYVNCFTSDELIGGWFSFEHYGESVQKPIKRFLIFILGSTSAKESARLIMTELCLAWRLHVHACGVWPRTMNQLSHSTRWIHAWIVTLTRLALAWACRNASWGAARWASAGPKWRCRFGRWCGIIWTWLVVRIAFCLFADYCWKSA
jgi:hypothetical protein